MPDIAGAARASDGDAATSATRRTDRTGGR